MCTVGCLHDAGRDQRPEVVVEYVNDWGGRPPPDPAEREPCPDCGWAPQVMGVVFVKNWRSGGGDAA